MIPRASALLALGIAVVAVIVVIAGAGSSYTIHAEFSDVGGLFINKDQVPEGLSSMDELLDPKWKGKIAVYDPTVSNGGSMSLAGLLAVKGDDFLHRLIVDNQAKYVSTSSQLTQWVAEGRYPIGFGVARAVTARMFMCTGGRYGPDSDHYRGCVWHRAGAGPRTCSARRHRRGG